MVRVRLDSYGEVAQSVEHATVYRMVASSSLVLLVHPGIHAWMVVDVMELVDIIDLGSMRAERDTDERKISYKENPLFEIADINYTWFPTPFPMNNAHLLYLDVKDVSVLKKTLLRKDLND